MGQKLKRLFLSLLFLLICSSSQATNYCNDASIAGCYEFRTEGGSGSTLDDTGANNQDGTIVNATWSSTIPSGYSGLYSLSFSVLNNCIVNLTSDASIELQNPLTTTAWVNLTLAAGREHGIWGGDSGSAFYWFGVKSDKTIAVDKRNNANVGNANTLLTEGAYTHLAFTQASTGAYVFYFNGVSDGTGTNDQTFTYNTGTINIGGDTNTVDNTWYGLLTQVASWTRQLNSTEVNDIKDNTLAGGAAVTTKIIDFF